jgi:hypothetical protein
LLSDDDLGALRERIATAWMTTEALARWLVAQGKLAEYQARALAALVPVPLVLAPMSSTAGSAPAVWAPSSGPRTGR